MNKLIVITLLLAGLAVGCSLPAANNNAAVNRATSNEQSQHGTHTGDSNVDHSSMDHSAMDHSAMQSSPGAAAAPFELQFLDSMIAHHKGAVEMAQLAEKRAQRAELKELATNIIGDQEREIGKMSELRERWFEGKAEAINMDFPGMSSGMRGMNITRLAGRKGNEFDIEFVRQMIPHHEGAIQMARAIGDTDSYAELKELAGDIITSQEAEIKQMRAWLSQWANDEGYVPR